MNVNTATSPMLSVSQNTCVYMRTKRFFIISCILIIAIIAGIYFCNKKVVAASEGKLYSSIESIPGNRVGLLLGTSKYLSNNSINPYYSYRIEATVQLLKAAKIKYIIISGDNSRKDYDEPTQMRADLINSGVDPAVIFLDYAGFRTFDSIVRAKKVFGQDSLTIISQAFHNQRAIFIASKEGIAAIGFNAVDVSKSVGYKVLVREKLARVKLFLDYLFGKKPKFLGPRITIPT